MGRPCTGKMLLEVCSTCSQDKEQHLFIYIFTFSAGFSLFRVVSLRGPYSEIPDCLSANQNASFHSWEKELTISQRARIFYEQIVNEGQPSLLIDNEGKLSNCFSIN